MQNVLKADRDVTVSKLKAKPGDSLAADAVIMQFYAVRLMQLLRGRSSRIGKVYRKKNPHMAPPISNMDEITIAGVEPFAALTSNNIVAISRYTSLTY